MGGYILIFLLFINILFSANLVSVDFIKDKNRVDIFLALDDKFNGRIINIGLNKFLLTNINSINSFNKKFKNFFIKEIKILPYKNSVLLLLESNFSYLPSAAISPDKYVIRFRIKSKQNIIKNNKFLDFNLSPLQIFIIVYIIVIVLIFLYVFNRYIQKKKEVEIVFRKPIDKKNYLVLIRFKRKYYLVIIGNSIFLLDIFEDNLLGGVNKDELYQIIKERRKLNKDLEIFKKYIAD